MARIRTIKPEFFTHDGLCDLSPLHRILFVGLWTQADREGRLEDRPRRLKVELLPYDTADVDALLDDLAAPPSGEPFIIRYEVAGQRYIAIPGFLQHQNPHIKEQPSRIPPPVQSDKHHASPVPAPDENSSSREEGKGREGKDQEGKEGVPAPAFAGPPAPEPSDLQAAWNAHCPPLPAWRELTPKRRTAAAARLRERGLEELREVIARIARSRFCLGENDRRWLAGPDWLLRPDTAAKVLEGNYDNRGPAPPARLIGGIAPIPADVRPKAACPLCGWDIATNPDGSFTEHACTEADTA